MFDQKIEELAENVRRSGKATSLPVNLHALCQAEEIELIPLQNHANFNGKIEFIPGVNAFVIYHPDFATYPWPRRLRFSLAHELGHFHFEEHRQALISGKTHNSVTGFHSKDPRERQADEFAAALLIPKNLMEPKIEKRGHLYLSEVMAIAKQCEVSAYATTIRYVRMASEACLTVLANKGKMVGTFCSDEARAIYLGFVTCSDLPAASPGYALCTELPQEEPVEKKHDAEAWFSPKGEDVTVWEHCVGLGQGFTLSLLAIER